MLKAHCPTTPLPYPIWASLLTAVSHLLLIINASSNIFIYFLKVIVPAEVKFLSLKCTPQDSKFRSGLQEHILGWKPQSPAQRPTQKVTCRQSHLNLRVNAEQKMDLQVWISQDNEDSDAVVRGFRKLRVAGLASFRLV